MKNQGEEETQRVQSAASSIRAKVLNQQKRAYKLHQTTSQGQFSVDPITAHNCAKAGLSFQLLSSSTLR